MSERSAREVITILREKEMKKKRWCSRKIVEEENPPAELEEIGGQGASELKVPGLQRGRGEPPEPLPHTSCAWKKACRFIRGKTRGRGIYGCEK